MKSDYPPIVRKIFDQNYKALYHALLASGFCTRCYVQPQAEGKVCCAECTEKNRLIVLRHNRKKGQRPWQPGKPGRPPLNRTAIE